MKLLKLFQFRSDMAVRKNESKRNVSKKSSVSSSVKINQSTSGDEELPVIPDVIASSRRSGNFTKILILLIVCVLVVNQVFIFKMWRNRGVGKCITRDNKIGIF